MQTVPIALRAPTVLGGAELKAELFPDSVRWPGLAIAPNDSFGAFEGMALRGVIATRMMTSSWKGQMIVAPVVSSA